MQSEFASIVEYRSFLLSSKSQIILFQIQSRVLQKTEHCLLRQNEDEKKKKLALQCQDVEDKALTILQQERSVQLLNVKELDVLLAWHQAPKVSGAKKADKLVQWQNIVASEKAPPLFARWTNDDEERMNGLTTESISIADTHYGRHAALMERELEAAVDSMSRDKRNELRRKLDECEMEDEATYVGGEQAQGTVSADGETGAV